MATLVSHYACSSGNLDLLKLLIKQYKLNPRIFSRGSSPEVAVRYGHVHILEWLRQEYHINVVSFKNRCITFLGCTIQPFVLFKAFIKQLFI